MRLLNLSEIETETLKKLKEERTKGEYCWTLTPFVPKFVFDSDNSVEQVTYLDADVWFGTAQIHLKPVFMNQCIIGMRGS